MTARGKSQRPPGPPTEPLPPVTVAPEFKSEHRCSGCAGYRVLQIPPIGWAVRIVGSYRIVGPISFCPWCSLELVKADVASP